MQSKGIEEKETIRFWRNLVCCCIRQDESHAAPRYSRTAIGHRLFPQTAVILYPDGMTPCLIRQKETDPPFAAAIIDERILFPHIATVGQTLKHAIIRWFIGMMLPVRPAVIAASRPDAQYMLPFLLVHFSHHLPCFSTHPAVPDSLPGHRPRSAGNPAYTTGRPRDGDFPYNP